ncbi:hypothetical protein QQP08_025503, partial [Theobroma cacao]
MTWLCLYLNDGVHAEGNGQGEAVDEDARNANKKAPTAPATKPEVPGTGGNAGEAYGSDSDDSDDSIKQGLETAKPANSLTGMLENLGTCHGY